MQLIDFNAAYILFITATAFDLAIRLVLWNKTHDEKLKHKIFWWI